jgi:hypothetical protein
MMKTREIKSYLCRAIANSSQIPLRIINRAYQKTGHAFKLIAGELQVQLEALSLRQGDESFTILA